MRYNNQRTGVAGNGFPGFRDGNASSAQFRAPWGICISTDGRIYVADSMNNRIRMIYNNQVTTIAGNGEYGFRDGNALDAMLSSPKAICMSTDDRLYLSDNENNRIRMIYNNEVTTIAGSGQRGFQDGNALDSMFKGPMGICCSNDGRIYVADMFNNTIRMIYHS